MNPIKRLSKWLGDKFETWIQKIAEENRPIENDHDYLSFDERVEYDDFMGIERDEADPRLRR